MKHFVLKWCWHLLFIFLLIGFIFLTYRDYGISWDEKKTVTLGKHYIVEFLNVIGIKHNLVDDTALFFPGEMLEVHLKGHGVVYDILTMTAALLFPSVGYETYHLIRGLFSILIFVLTAYITYRLISLRASFIAMILLFFFPRFFGDIFDNSLDMPAVLFFSLTVGYFIYFLKSNQNLKKQLLFGFVLALAIGQRFLLVYVAFLSIIFWLLFRLIVKKRNFKEILPPIVVIVVSTLVCLHLTHPYLFQRPLTGLIDMMQSSRQYQWNASVLFDGVFINASELPRRYLLQSMLITIPEAILFLFFAGLMRLIYRLKKRKGDVIKRLLYFYLLALFFTPLILNFLLRPILYDSWRHFMFLTIPMVIIACFGLKWVLELKLQFIKGLILALLGVNIFFVGAEMVQLHPYQYLYYNSFVGGLKGAYGKYETDYWGKAYREAVLWFNDNINDGKKNYLIKAEGDPLSSLYYFKDNMKLVKEASSADYIFTFTRWNLHQRYQGKTIHTVERKGVPLIFIIAVSNS